MKNFIYLLIVLLFTTSCEVQRITYSDNAYPYYQENNHRYDSYDIGIYRPYGFGLDYYWGYGGYGGYGGVYYDPFLYNNYHTAPFNNKTPRNNTVTPRQRPSRNYSTPNRTPSRNTPSRTAPVRTPSRGNN